MLILERLINVEIRNWVLKIKYLSQDYWGVIILSFLYLWFNNNMSTHIEKKLEINLIINFVKLKRMKFKYNIFERYIVNRIYSYKNLLNSS